MIRGLELTKKNHPVNIKDLFELLLHIQRLNSSSIFNFPVLGKNLLPKKNPKYYMLPRFT